MKTEKTRIVDWLYRREFPKGPLNFEQLMFSAVEGALDKSSLDVEAYVYANQNSLWNAIVERIELDVKRGVSPLFIVLDRSTQRVVWYPFCSEITVVKERKKLFLCRSRPAILRRIDVLGDREYEALGCIMATISGASEVCLTPRGNEGGIDFFAHITLPGKTHIFSSSNASLRVIGQSKKYRDKVDVERVRGFITTIQEIRDLSPSIRHLMPTWFLEGSGPIVGWLVAHSGFQSGAIVKARNNGVLLSTSLDLAEIAATSRLLHPYSSSEERAYIMCQLVKGLLQEYDG